MAENLTIARPYAQAVFEIAKEDKSFDQWSQALEGLACAVSDETFLSILNNASTREEAAQDLITATEPLLDEKGKNFVCIVCENDRCAVLPEIYQEFVQLRNDFMKIKVVEVVSAHPLAAADQKAIKAKLEAKHQATIELHNTVDPSIIGGLIIRIGDEVIDGSIKSSLSRLASTLK